MVFADSDEVVGRRRKKLIAAARCTFPAVAAIVYNCKICDDVEKERMGCVDDAPHTVWKTNSCYECGGNNDECIMCHGSNNISVNRCPRSIAVKASWPFVLLPFFYDYYEGLRHGVSIWPDGKGRLNQPVKLIMAMNILFDEYVKCNKDKS